MSNYNQPESELSSLLGSEKQISYGNRKRLEVAENVARLINRRFVGDGPYPLNTKNGILTYPNKEEAFRDLTIWLNSELSAKYWIELEATEYELAEIFFNYIKTVEKNGNISDLENKETIIKPENPTKTGIAKIRTSNNVIKAIYVKDNDFIAIVKNNDYKWNGREWELPISKKTGNAEDRVAELGNLLLAKGFTVSFESDILAEMSISGNFETRCYRWVEWYAKIGKLALSWEKWNNTLYNSAKILPGAKWRNGHMVVPVEFYNEVLDFAETFHFKISEIAKSHIEEYIETEKSFKVASVSPKTKKELDDMELLKKSLQSQTGILEDLKDEDE